MRSSDQLHNLRHSLAHLLASAVLEMFPKAQLGVGPVIDNGFYYDFLLPRSLTPEDLKKLEKRMRELAKQKLSFEKSEMGVKEAVKFFEERNQPFKVELIEDIKKFGTTKLDEIVNGDEELGRSGETTQSSILNPQSSKVSLYKTGKFIDLCRGGHVNNTSEIKTDSFKLDKISGAYWRGDQSKPQLQRIYGLAFSSKAELDAYMKLQIELEKRDHRILGPKLGLFLFHEFAPGIPFYLPNGMVLKNALRKFVREVSYGPGYKEVRAPQMLDAQAFKLSGHWDHFKDDMFIFKAEGRDFALKPMNCPGHMVLYKQGLYSYKDLPLRLAEMTTLYRNELSGALNGLTRVRAFGQDDSHIFLTPDQISAEVADLLKRMQVIYKTFNMKIDDVLLSTRPDKALGTKEEWKNAEDSLASALKKAKWKFELNPGDGAFYGPKIDMQVTDILGRKWQLATIQLDFQMPRRFGLEYVAKDGSRKTPIVVHRAILGSFERFIGILIEQFAGAFPAWLAPVQVIILPISSKQNAYAKAVAKELLALNPEFRVEIDDRDETIGKKIRESSMQKIPYLIVAGEKEAKAKKIAIRSRGEKDLGQMATKKFGQMLELEIENRR